jgi:hypothetical protein
MDAWRKMEITYRGSILLIGNGALDAIIEKAKAAEERYVGDCLENGTVSGTPGPKESALAQKASFEPRYCDTASQLVTVTTVPGPWYAAKVNKDNHQVVNTSPNPYAQ